ncbi:Flp family type IVb pilin [Anaeromyxobacter paludicola]|uniref:Flp family type IVb pilin n=1 Tax=Anaeromyxobacter paludicola TaxID=2918171 RepID=A0ABM7X9J3_9BACT|nr:Flp family type IVb pilin [Anaeromyxobacter paludicola]BDG08497.1 hypothetical protein AMPC_16100 [Anaeromyxobacter paludicola]
MSRSRSASSWRPRALWLDERGATAVEYALLASFITGAIAAAVGTFGGAVKALFLKIVTVWPN